MNYPSYDSYMLCSCSEKVLYDKGPQLRCISGCLLCGQNQIKIQTQKRINNEVGISSSQHLSNMVSINIFNFQKNLDKNNMGVAVKHGSYARRLGKIKGQNLKDNCC